MQVYFSHSYRDVAINGYFLEHFLAEDLPLRGDQKTPVWCVAKLERFMTETTGFISVIPRRPTEKEAGGYSPHILHELNLARRAHVPRLLFVDDLVLRNNKLQFPPDAVAFKASDPQEGRDEHIKALQRFTQELETGARRPRTSVKDHATVVSSGGAGLDEITQSVAELLRRRGFSVTVLTGKHHGHGLDDVRVLEPLWRAELCVFLLGDRLSDAHVALGMAYAQGIPSVRMQHDRHATETSPEVNGLIRWSEPEAMLVEFEQQLTSYREGLVMPVEMARSSNPTEAARRLGTTQGWARSENIWAFDDGPGLLRHLYPTHLFVRDEVDRVRAQLKRAVGRMEGREGSREVCAMLYDGLRRHRFGYEFEEPTGVRGTQGIRAPRQIVSQNAATCIDVVCLFASMLDAASQTPLLVVLDGPDYSHALAGYRVRGERPWLNRGKEDLLSAVERRDAVLFEATGVLVSDQLVGAETDQERVDKVIGSFEDSTRAAIRLLQRPDVVVRHFIDAHALREQLPRVEQ